MRAQVKNWNLYGDGRPDPKVHYFPNGDVLIEGVVVDPPSSEGRRVDFHVTVDQVPELLKALRTAAIAIRSTPMDAPSDASNTRDEPPSAASQGVEPQ